MYNSSRAKEISTTKVIAAGINDNCKLVGAELKMSPIQNNAFIEITFNTSDGLKFTHTEWTPTKFEGMSDADLEKKYDTQYARMLQILECFYKEDELNFDGESFVEFANWLVDLLNKADKTISLRVKLVYNNKGYLTMPSYAKFKFIERMDTTVSAVKILDKDQIVRPVIADAEPTIVNTIGNGTTTIDPSTNPNGLPF